VVTGRRVPCSSCWHLHHRTLQLSFFFFALFFLNRTKLKYIISYNLFVQYMVCFLFQKTIDKIIVYNIWLIILFCFPISYHRVVKFSMFQATSTEKQSIGITLHHGFCSSLSPLVMAYTGTRYDIIHLFRWFCGL
jgi:hypothetical protein